MINSILLTILIFVLVLASGLFSGAETGIYQLSRLRLRIGVEKRKLPFTILSRLMADSNTLLISILIGTNLACYITTSIVTFMFFEKLGNEHTAEILATIITAPLLFVFAEIIPKSIFYYRPESLLVRVSVTLLVFTKLFTWCGLVPLLKLLSQMLAKLTAAPTPGKKTLSAVTLTGIQAIAHDTREEGLMSTTQTDIINNLEGISRRDIKSVMTPLRKVVIVDINSDRSALLQILKDFAFTYLPVYEINLPNIVGFINIYECLTPGDEFANLRNYLKPIRKLPASITISEAIRVMQTEKLKIVLVTGKSRSKSEMPLGILTMKDLVEEIVGELGEW